MCTMERKKSVKYERLTYQFFMNFSGKIPIMPQAENNKETLSWHFICNIADALQNMSNNSSSLLYFLAKQILLAPELLNNTNSIVTRRKL